MADFVFNVAKGRVNEIVRRIDTGADTAGRVRLMLLKAADTDAVHKDYDTVDAVIANVTTAEADFTNYARKTLSGGADFGIVIDDAADDQYSDATDQTWTSAGGVTNNTLTDALIYYDPDGTDTLTACVPLTQHDFAVTTDGSDLTLRFASTGWFAAID